MQGLCERVVRDPIPLDDVFQPAALPAFQAARERAHHGTDLFLNLVDWCEGAWNLMTTRGFPQEAAGQWGGGRPAHAATSPVPWVGFLPVERPADLSATVERLSKWLTDVVPPIRGARYLYHATTHDNAASILARGINPVFRRLPTDFGPPSFYLNPDLRDTLDWCWNCSRLSPCPALLVYRDVRGALNREELPCLEATGASNPTWSDVVRFFREGEQTPGAMNQRVANAWSSVEGAQAMKEGDLWVPRVVGGVLASQYAVKFDEEAVKWDVELAAVVVFRGVGDDLPSPAASFGSPDDSGFPPLK